MVRAVVRDESLDAAIDAIVANSQRGLQVGLVVGRIGSSRDSVLSLVRTPVKEDGNDAAALVAGSSRKNSRSAPADTIAIDIDWVAEHARQVSKMLLGGFHVAGVYCLAPESAFKQSASILCQAANATVAATSNAKSFSDSLVLHIATSPRRVSCRVCSSEASGTLSLKPCDWKLAKLIPNLQSLACSYVFDVSLPVSSAAGSFKSVLESWMDTEVQRLEAAEVLVDGVLEESNAVLSACDGVRDVELLLPLNSASRSAKGSSQLLGTMKLKGAVHARAYAFLREPLSNAVLSLKQDIIASLRSRVELICEESDEKSTPLLAAACSESNQEFTCVLPKRVLLPWSTALLCCDYVSPSESLKDVEERCKDLLAMELDVQSVVSSEGFHAPDEKDDASSSKAVAATAAAAAAAAGSGAAAASIPKAALLAAFVAALLAMLLVLVKWR